MSPWPGFYLAILMCCAIVVGMQTERVAAVRAMQTASKQVLQPISVCDGATEH